MAVEFERGDTLVDSEELQWIDSSGPTTDKKMKRNILERQQSLEEHSVVEGSKDSETLMSSSLSPEQLKKEFKDKKKKHFKVFSRLHKSKEKNSKLDNYLSESLPTQGTAIISAPLVTNSLGTPQPSLASSWDAATWKERRNGSAHSSNASLEMEMSDGEIVESLVNPTRNRLAARLSPEPEEDRSESRGSSSPMEYLVNITLMSGHNLAIRDRTGSSDPYVKFKCPPFKYRSSIIHRNLNPEWNESFSFKTQNLSREMVIRVYDHDRGSMDDFMGGQTLDLSSHANGIPRLIDLGLVDPEHASENLGYIRLFVKVAPFSEEDERRTSVTAEKKPKCSYGGAKVWNSILTVTLLGGSNLPAMDQNGLSDPYCKFKLGSQKYKSKILYKTLNPKWMERFDLRMYNTEECDLHVEVWDKDFPQNDDYLGGCSISLGGKSWDQTHDFKLPLLFRDGTNTGGTVHFTLTITGIQVKEEDGLSKAEKITGYGLFNSLNMAAIKERNVGHLRITVTEAMDLVPCHSFVMLELGNCRVRTHTAGKGGNPIWDKAFDFTVGDIHDELELMVYRANPRNEVLLGRVKVPLHMLRGGPQKFALKDRHCLSRARGVLFIEAELIYNPVRAMIRTVNPREDKLLEPEEKFKRKILMDNIRRVKNLVYTIISTIEFVKTLWTWENKVNSATAFLVFLIVTIFGQLWMLCLAVMLIFVVQYLVLYLRGEHLWQNRISENIHQVSKLYSSNNTSIADNEDYSDSDLEDDKNSGLRDKFRQVQEILVLVQNILGEVADMEERVKNLFNWKVPFLGCMAICVMGGATVLLYFVPLRYIILVWGINKFTKRLRKPDYISNNELLDFLSRCPTNEQLEQWKELPLTVTSKSSENTRGRKAKRSSVKSNRGRSRSPNK